MIATSTYYLGGATSNRSTCLNYSISDWDLYDDCFKNDWLYSETTQWLQAPYSSDSRFASIGLIWILGGDGCGNCYVNTKDISVRPTLYLNAKTQITSGTGEKNSPYQLKLE